MDKIFIHELKVETIIGCLNWERHIKQPIFIDMEIDYDCSLAGRSDSLIDTLDYSEIANTVTDFIMNSQFNLLESLAQHVAKLILEKYPISRIKIKVSKPGAIANAKLVAVAIERVRQSLPLVDESVS